MWNIQDKTATESLDTREKGRNIETDRLFVSYEIRILFIFILVAGTPGFAGEYQLGGKGFNRNDYFLFLFCEWKTIWSLNYRPIDEQEKKEIKKIIQV